MKKLVIFDLDGTLLNTIDDLGQAVNYALQKSGFPTHNIASYHFFVGNGVHKLISRSLPEDYRSEATINTVLADFKQYYGEHMCEYTKPYDGIRELLSKLTSHGVRVAVASNKYQIATERLMRHFFPDIEFTAICGHVDGMNPKPDPSIVFSILAQALVPKANVLYVGDSGVDMETARRACIESAGVTWGFRSEKELNENYADHIIRKPEDILEIVFKEDV